MRSMLASRRTLLACVLGLAAMIVPRSSSGQALNLFGRGRDVVPQPLEAPEFGTTSQSVLLIGADAFQLVQGTGGPTNQNTTARTCGAACIFIATPSVPSGAVLQNLEVEGCDGDPAGQLGFALFQFGTPVQVGTVVSSVFLSGGPDTPGCNLYNIPLNRTVANAAEKLVIDINLDAGTNLSFSAARLRYTLQVSPAPGAATFGDVPTNHPFFQFVEALAASGITGGCGSGNYCPDNPVTRGQMAVFLSKALGLHFPN